MVWCSKTGSSRPLILSLGLSDHSAVSINLITNYGCELYVFVIMDFPEIAMCLFAMFIPLQETLKEVIKVVVENKIW